MLGVLKDLPKRRFRRYRMAFSAAEEAGLIVGKMRRLRQELSMNLWDTLSYHTRACLEKQAAAESSCVEMETPTITPASGSGESSRD